MLQLQRPGELQKELEEFIDDLHRLGSPVYHQWLTAQEFGERYGASVLRRS
jgi:subtilase family serine protease